MRWGKVIKKEHIYTMKYYSAIKNDKIMAFAGKWMKFENIMLSEIRQSQKTKGRMISLISRWWCIMGGRGQEWRKEGLYRGKREVERVGGKEKITMNQTTLPYVNVWLHKWYVFTPCADRETTRISFCLQ